MSEPTTQSATSSTTPPAQASTQATTGGTDIVSAMSDPLFSAETPFGDIAIPSPTDLLLDGIDLACKLFEGDAHSNHGKSYADMMNDLAKYEEGDPSIGPLQLTASFATEDPSVPAYVKFGPESPMTQQLMADSGVAGAREAYYLDGFDQTASKFRVDDFVRETLELESPVSLGETADGKTSVDVSDFTLTEHQVGSYTVRICETPDHELMFVVLNNTGAASATRNPLTQESLIEDRERPEPGGFGTIHQAYYWTEPLRQ